MKHDNGFPHLVEVVRQLYQPGGCPWDREQTHESLKVCIAEECQEVLDAIDHKDMENLKEELGDQLYLILLNCMIGEESGSFTLEDVILGVTEKMIRRHPHVFGDLKLNSRDEGVELWNRIKKQEKGKKP